MPSDWIAQFDRLPYPDFDCTGRTIIVIGANVGLGKEAARHFVRLNASKVIMGVRSIEKGKAALQDIENTTRRTGVAEIWEIDLSSYVSVKAFAAQVAGLPRIDALVANASIATRKFEVFEDNESTITVNVVSTFLLILLLLPTLRKSAEKWSIIPVITVVSSNVHSWVQFPEWKSPNIFDNINSEKTANMPDRYPLSKLLQVLAVREIAAKISKTKPKIVINTINPGVVNTELTRNAEGLLKIFISILKFLMARSPEVASAILVHAATEGPESQGQYFANCDLKKGNLSPFVQSEEGQEAQKKFWGELVQKLENIQPGIMKNLE